MAGVQGRAREPPAQDTVSHRKRLGTWLRDSDRWQAAPGVLAGPEPGKTQGRSEGTSGKGRWGREPVLATSDWGRRLALETTGSLAGAVSPGAPMGTATARKGAVNGVLFDLLAIWVFIFQTSSHPME